MDRFNYKNGELHIEQLPALKIIEEVGTACYVYSKNTFLDHLHKIQNAYAQLDTTVCYSIKACSNINILKFLSDSGSGFDIVSGGELFRAVKAGADMKKIVYAGVGKTDEEIKQALDAGIEYFNIESEQELENLIRLSSEKGCSAKAALRVNPDVDPKTHAYITTGKKESKFGVDIERAEKVFDTYSGNPSVKLRAIHIHLGSGGNTVDPYVEAIEKILGLIDTLRSKGYEIEALDIGGGYGADYVTGYGPSAKQYAEAIVPLLKDKNLKLILEPGKSIAANAGILLSEVQYVKQGGSKKFAIVDAAMNDMIRPSLYDAFHFIWPVKTDASFVPKHRNENMQMEGLEKYDVVGPICEGSDFLAKERLLPPLKRGDVIGLFTAGAYGFTMASNYNSRPMLPEVLVDGDDYTIIRKRQTYDDLISLEQ
ncbi:Diaminopimelate decarboxylase [Sedimentisphaera cyanobacteriorum]|uniref:Diaminopimelate decarboxylase n=1 Tax=Sedimentisphaera cyanobacteriorum TaxID=1940790 RepID=A0A1Q2HMZ5_9BACT|nr:diaminopimelate decarboxylase [Sedimentisphaera cyanobacteriorum]AQQ08808.1 Diaminopimelate decarboxylase [Sedimentisphaera cyanobacteriorum]